MKKFFRYLMPTLALTAGLTACQLDPGTHQNNDPVVITTDIDYNTAKFIAETKLKKMIQNTENADGKWTASTTIGKGYPVSTPGIQDPAYYEFKVMNGSEDAGYILVSLSQADIQVPEITMEGKSLTEEYQQATGRTDLKVIRYSVFESAAQTKDSAMCDSPEVLAKLDTTVEGIKVFSPVEKGKAQEEFSAKNQGYVQAITQSESVPTFTKSMLQTYYNRLDSQENNLENQGAAPTIQSKTVYLRSKYANGWSLPQWTQPTQNGAGQVYVGCGSTAWAMVYGYWQTFKGKTRLFDGAPIYNRYSEYYCNYWASPDRRVYDAMWSIRGYVKSTVFDSSGASVTWPLDMPLGSQYGNSKGYSVSVQHVNAWYYNQTFSEIQADRPVIMCICSSPTYVSLIADHYVGIEGVYLEFWSNNPGTSIEVAYYANWGHGSSKARKWIYLMYDGIDNNKYANLHSLYDTYFININ